MKLTDKAFKAYDIRGVVPTEVNAEMAYRVGRSFAMMLGARTVVIGHDIRLTGPELSTAVAEGLRDAGANVLDIGQCGTEMIYYATTFLEADGGVMITASHNPANYNGMKLVRRGAKPVSADTGLMDIAKMVVNGEVVHEPAPGVERGSLEQCDIMEDYVHHLLSYVEVDALKPLKLVVNPGNGGAGVVVKELAKHLPCEFIYLNEEPDGTFPHGVPNPLLPDNRAATAQLVLEQQADMGIAWDGDFDRCFFFDAKANFIEGYYLVGLLAQVFLAKEPGAKIMYDPRLTWNTEDLVREHGGQLVRCKSGHAFMKECMREKGVLYGGEMSSHHYFRDFTYCDSGMLPWLIVLELLSKTGKTLEQLVGERVAKFPCSGEINRKVADAQAVLQKLEEQYTSPEAVVDHLDGISVELPQWRFNVRASNTEPVLRLNVETRGDQALLKAKTEELLALIGGEKA